MTKDERIKELESAAMQLYDMVHESENIQNKIKANELYDTIIGQSLPIDSVSYCAEQTKNVLTNKFCNIAKEHVGETFDKVPEATDILKAIDVIEKHCS